jgi:3-hydroxybutyryl-CoA dehydrogenase
MMNNNKISVIGAGTMGNGITHVFAKFGYEVNLIDINADQLQKGLAMIDKNLAREVKKEKISQTDANAARARISSGQDLQAVADSFLIIEAATENKEIKLNLFRDLAKFSDPAAVLATNTSSISITEIATVTGTPERVIGMHFMNPVPMMKLVEIIRGHDTNDETLQLVLSTCEKLNKTALASEDYPGFVANRILMPMINEAIFALFEGVATREAIDGIMKLGMAHPMGPLALADFIGLDVCLAILEVLYSGLGDTKYRPCPMLKKMVAAGHLGRKSGRGFYDYN